ncbi:uncharacterized protein [Panulirus ornatus]|uniref:uncharacterized protein n=1 Tax=Panulirus ornatus TaxID=150431 RepID=UPI003A8B7FB0
MLQRVNLCKQNYSKKGRTKFGLRNHLNSKHPEAYKAMLHKEDENKESKKRKASPPVLVKIKQQTLKSCSEEKQVWDSTNAKSQSIDHCFAKMIVMDNLPFSRVKDIGFICLMQEAARLYPLRHHKYYRDLIFVALTRSSSIKITFDVYSHSLRATPENISSDNVHCVMRDADPWHKKLERKIMEELSKRFDSLESNVIYAVAISLDPRYKAKFFIPICYRKSEE